MSTKKILYIAPHSFPISSSESICNSKIAYTLADMGYRIDVFCCVEPYHYPENQELDQLLGIHNNMHIYKVVRRRAVLRKSSLFEKIKSAINHLVSFIHVGYVYNGSVLSYDIIKAINKINHQGSTFPYDVIITRGYYTDIVGIYFKKKYGIKWIANWNDPYPDEKFPPPYGKGIEAHLSFVKQKTVQAVQKYADIHTFPNPRLRDYMLRYFKDVRVEQTLVIPHMAMFKLSTLSSETQNQLTILHCGNLTRPRNPHNFLKALSEVVNESFYNHKIKVQFLGLVDNDFHKMVKEYGLEDYIELIHPQPYNRCLELISKCSISLIIEAICEEGIYLPTKVVDSLQCQKPLFCVSPKEGVLYDLINKYHIGYVCDNTDVYSIRCEIKKLIVDYFSNNIPVVDLKSVAYFFDDNIKRLYSDLIN